MNATSIKTRLKNQGKVCGKIMEEMLLAYGFERASAEVGSVLTADHKVEKAF